MKNQSTSFDGLTFFYASSDAETADLVRQVCIKSLQIIQHLWGLASPHDCRIYVLNSDWLGSMFHAAPWSWRIWMGFTLPLWYFRARRTWQIAAGWALPFGRRRFIGIKPSRLIQLSDRSMGARIFTQPDNLEAKVQHTTCHELTHACTAHLKLPSWLNEGLAMYTVDHFAAGSTIRPDTLHLLHQSSGTTISLNQTRLNLKDPDAVVYLYVRGYWIVRYFEEVYPGVLKSLLAVRLRLQELETGLASACGLSRESFWQQIDHRIVSYFDSSQKDRIVA